MDDLYSSGNEIWDDPEMLAWVKRVLDELVPMISDSAITISIVPTGQTDIKFAVELGLSIMLDKPIILAVRPGTPVPDHLRRVADEIVEFNFDDPASLQSAISRAIARIPTD